MIAPVAAQGAGQSRLCLASRIRSAKHALSTRVAPSGYPPARWQTARASGPGNEMRSAATPPLCSGHVFTIAANLVRDRAKSVATAQRARIQSLELLDENDAATALGLMAPHEDYIRKQLRQP
jgi:hypothetical protein